MKDKIKEGDSFTPEQKEKLDLSANMLTDMLYNPKTKNEVIKMIKDAPPEQSIPYTVNAVYERFEGMTNDKIGEIPLNMKLATGVHLFSEVMEMAENMGLIPEEIPEQTIQSLLKDTIKIYIEKGLKDGTVDPIDLQNRVEPLLSDKEKKIGLDVGSKSGIPMELQQGQVSLAIADKARRPLEMKNKSLQKENEGMQSALQGISSQPQQGGM